jgi:hypothetical protein
LADGCFVFGGSFGLAVLLGCRHKCGVKPLPPLMLVTCVLLCSCASQKEKSAVPPTMADTKSVKRSTDPSSFFPEGVTWKNATPTQISDAVFTAVKANPDGAVEIVEAAMDEIKDTGRFPITAGDDGKQCIDPEPKWTLFRWLFKRKHLKPTWTYVLSPDSQMGSGRPADTLAGAIRDWIRWPRPKPKQLEFEEV